MRGLTLLMLCLMLAGCVRSTRVDRAAFDQQYEQTALAPGVLTAVPLRMDPDEPSPVIVNWWYVGSRWGKHFLVYRELTWDEERKPVGRERWYRIAEAELPVASPTEFSSDPADWLPLYEASGEVALPPDLATTRKNALPSEPKLTNPQKP